MGGSWRSSSLRAGDVVEVRSKEEILRTLDERGRLEELPFMPQMFRYCGQRFKVYKRAHKTCDTVDQTGGRRVDRTVHLDVRCDGEAYGGCQAACLIFWKEAWLKPVGEERRPGRSPSGFAPPASSACAEDHVWAATRRERTDGEREPRYVCQATQLPYFTTLLPWWNLRQYLEDFTSGNASFGHMVRGFAYAAIFNLSKAGNWVGRPLRILYDRFQALLGGVRYPRYHGRIPAGQKTPSLELNLQPGELVRVRPYEEILKTLDKHNRNRGLFFDAEHVPYCGGVHRVKSRVEKYIDEKTGQLKVLKNPSVILENVWCRARYSDHRMFCPRSIYSWWREIWLERVDEGNDKR